MDILRRIVVSMESGRDINIDELLLKELCAVPLSLATTDCTLRSTQKSELATIIACGVKERELSASNLKTCTTMDWMDLVRAIGKPPNTIIFGDYATVFINKVKTILTAMSRELMSYLINIVSTLSRLV